MNFNLEAFYNPYLPAQSNRVDAILTVTSDGTGGAKPANGSVVGLVVDTSGSMQGERIKAVKTATRKAIGLLDESVSFFIVTFSTGASVLMPLAPATPVNKAAADARVQWLDAGGTTQMSCGLNLARQEFMKAPDAIHHALFLTDGKNNDQDEPDLEHVLAQCEGLFQCDCRGVGVDWQPKQLKKISEKLLGSARIIPEPSGIEADFNEIIRSALAMAVNDVRLRLWTPKTAKIKLCKQVSPEIVDLTLRGVSVNPQTCDYPTGAWSNEFRDYQIAIEWSSPGEVGEEILGCRPSIVYPENQQTTEIKAPGARIVASWTADEALSTRINPQVAHYTGQGELADAIQQGLEARERGDVEVATRFLGKAVKLAHDSGNEGTTRRLQKVVEIEDPSHGTVRLKRNIQQADTMDLDLMSARTARAKRPS